MAHAVSRDEDEIHGINVTPLVDIMLVLLLIFMITTHLDKPSVIGATLPRASTATEAPVSTLNIVIMKDGSLRLDGHPTSLALIEAQARRGNEETTAIVAGDQDSTHKHLIHVIDSVRRGGVFKIAFAAELEQRK